MPTADQHRAYLAVYRAIGSDPLRDRLHALAHDERIPAGIVRAWALQLMRWRVGDLDRGGQPVTYPCPPSGSVAVEVIMAVDRVVCEHVPDFRSERWRALAADEDPDG
jgi:hypothetical protein